MHYKKHTEEARRLISLKMQGNKNRMFSGYESIHITTSPIRRCKECKEKYLKPLGCLLCKYKIAKDLDPRGNRGGTRTQTNGFIETPTSQLV